MDPLTLGLISSAASPVIDMLTGASKKRRDALDAQQKQLQSIMDRITGDMGASASTSLAYKTAMAQADKAYDRRAQANAQDAAASGMSDEARLGQMNGLNDSYNNQQMSALDQAEQDRKRLQGEYDQVASQKAGVAVDQANNTVNQQNQVIGGAMSMLPFLLSQNPVGSANSLLDNPTLHELSADAMAIKPVQNLNVTPSSSSASSLAALLRNRNTFPSASNYFDRG